MPTLKDTLANLTDAEKRALAKRLAVTIVKRIAVGIVVTVVVTLVANKIVLEIEEASKK